MDPRRDGRALDQLFAAHLVLGASWVGWRLLESTPSLASAWGGTFAASTPGRALALATLLACVLALFVVLVRTVQLVRDVRAPLLAVALLLALPARAPGVDVFDLVYTGLVALFATAWFGFGRRVAATAR